MMPPPQTEIVTATTLPRDKRVDELGFIAEVAKHHADPLKTTVKLSMIDKAVLRVRGDFFEALLQDKKTSSIDAGKFYLAFKAGRIQEADFIAAISVGATEAKKCLSGKELEEITTSKPANPALTVTRIKGMDAEVLEALKGLSKNVQAAAGQTK